MAIVAACPLPAEAAHLACSLIELSTMLGALSEPGVTRTASEEVLSIYQLLYDVLNSRL